MKKWCLMVAAMLCLMIPTVGSAQGLPDFLQAVQSGLSEGLSAGSAAMEKDLALSMTLSDSRVEEGRDVTLTIRAENPRPAETGVSLTLNLPERLAAQTGDELTWNAVLPAAQVDETGAFVPSVTTFTRVLTLMPGGESAQGTVTAEMNVGSRFYRESLPIALCVADISTRASVSGTQNGRATVGETLTYTVEIANAGMAEKNVPVELILPADAALEGELPEGFAQVQRQIRGEVGVPAAGSEPSVVTLTFPMTIREDALAEDEDALRLLSGVLRVDGQRIALPRVQLCGPKISAKLLPQTDNLKAGEETALRVVLVNAGMAEADVRVSCMLPEGISLVTAPKPQQDTEAKESGDNAEAEEEAPKAVAPEQDDGGADAEAVLADSAEQLVDEPEIRQENGRIVFDLHMDAAGEEAYTRVVTLRVRADEPQENIKERLLGTTLAWQIDAGETQLGEAACVRVYRPMVLGLTKDEWMGIFWAGLLLVVTVSCLFAAFNSDNKREKYCE